MFFHPYDCETTEFLEINREEKKKDKLGVYDFEFFLNSIKLIKFLPTYAAK